MGILDEAIREHLELKRQHGAPDPELKKLEDEAFGPPPRPDELMAESQPEAEPPTQLLSEPPAEAEGEPLAESADPDREPAPAEPPEPEPQAASLEEEDSPGPSTEEAERQAIAEQPTELFDVEEEYAAEAESPSEEELADEELAEPRLAPADSLSGLEGVEEAEIEVSDETPAAESEFEDSHEEDDFFSEQRLSEELDQALEAPRNEPQEELDDEEGSGELEPFANSEEVREEPISEEAPHSQHEDVLEETPDFLEETPEDDELWFEQKPPKDFDFDD